jgi:hypothetical protein
MRKNMKTGLLISLIIIISALFTSCGGEDRTERVKELYSSVASAECGDYAAGGETIDLGDCENGYYCEDNSCVIDPCPYANFPNHNNGDCWSDKAANTMNHADAISYCEGLGGHLPTISELRTLIQNCSKTETGGSCGVTDSCLSYSECRNDDCSGCSYDSSGKYSVFGDTGWFWSSSVLSDYTNDAWYVNFFFGNVSNYYRSSSIFVRCVR